MHRAFPFQNERLIRWAENAAAMELQRALPPGSEGTGQTSLGHTRWLVTLAPIRRPVLSVQSLTRRALRADHCLDVLRSAAMCHADTTLTTFGWSDQAQPMLNTRPIQHRCMDWDALIASVEHRVVSHDEISALENPLSQS